MAAAPLAPLRQLEWISACLPVPAVAALHCSWLQHSKCCRVCTATSRCCLSFSVAWGQQSAASHTGQSTAGTQPQDTPGLCSCRPLRRPYPALLVPAHSWAQAVSSAAQSCQVGRPAAAEHYSEDHVSDLQVLALVQSIVGNFIPPGQESTYSEGVQHYPAGAGADTPGDLCSTGVPKPVPAAAAKYCPAWSVDFLQVVVLAQCCVNSCPMGVGG